MPIIKFVDIPFGEWRGEGLGDKIQEASMRLYEAGLAQSAENIGEILSQQGVDVRLRQAENPDENIIIVQRKQT